LGTAEVAGDEGVTSEASRQFAIVGGEADFIGDSQHSAVRFLEPGFDDDFVVVLGGREVTAIGFGDDHENAVLLFHVAVGEALSPAPLGAGDFHPDEVVGVIDDAHLIGFGVANTEAGFSGWSQRAL